MTDEYIFWYSWLCMCIRGVELDFSYCNPIVLPFQLITSTYFSLYRYPKYVYVQYGVERYNKVNQTRIPMTLSKRCSFLDGWFLRI